MTRFLQLLFFFFGLALILPVSAQENTKKSRTIRILFLNAPKSAPKAAYLHDGTSSREVELPRMNLSALYDVPAGPLKLRLLAESVKDPKQIPDKAPAAQIPETMGDAYLLCISDPANTVLPLRIDVVDAGNEKFRDGMMLWINITDHDVGGYLAKEKIRVKPQSRVLVNAPVAEPDSYPVIMLHMIKGDDQIYPICETRWMHDPKSRQLVFVFEEPGRRLPRILGFTDFRPPPPPEKKPEEKPKP